MADVRVNLSVSSGGTTAAETRQASALADQLERGTRAATAQSRIRQASPISSGASQPGQDEVSGYRQFRGASGTGASARDFSKQAAGLGGLVHVYATFAANIFALTAGFTALSKAADTSNMVAGLNQLGSASGKNLGSLSKQLVSVSDNAISLKDALTATAQASAGGLTGDQLLRITAVAKNASQALGRDMPDALSRLTRGITKIEPELLDELGILVKVDAANINYARSLGKTASSLTDLEKRQAFANETISQGEKKFKDIELSANPYQKILASATNLSQVGLELVNKVLSPVINLLASSPTALSFALAGVASTLLKQAIPALGQWRASLNASAVTARETSIKINEAFKQFQSDNINRNANAISQRVSGQRAEMEASLNALKDSAAKGIKGTKSEISKIVSQPIEDITDKQISKIATAEKSFRTKAANLISTPEIGPPIDPSIATEHAKQAEALTKQANALKNLREQIPQAKQESLDFINAQKKAQEDLARTQGRFSEASQRQRIADRAERVAAKAEILSNVAQNTQVMGVRGAFTALRNDISQGQKAVEQIGKVGEAGYVAAVAARKPLEGLAATATLVRGSFAIATNAVTTFLSAFAPWMAIVGLAIAGISALVEYMSTNTKELKVFSDSIDELKSSTELMGNTIDNINKKPFLELLSVESIQARSTAIEGLSNSIIKTINSLIKADSSATGFDKFIDGWKTLWGGDLRSIATKGISSAISESLKSATDGPARDKLKSSIKDILGTNEDTAGGIQDALKKLTNAELVTKLQDLSKASLDFSISTTKSSDTLVSFSEALNDTNKQVGLLTVGLTLTDPLSKVGASIVTLSNSIKNALDKGPINSIAIFNKLINEPGKSTFLPTEIFGRLLTLKGNVDSVSASIAGSSKAVDKYRTELAKLQADEGKFQERPEYIDKTKPKEDTETKAVKAAKAGLEVSERSLAEGREKEKKLAIELGDINKSIFDYGAKVISLGLKNASEQAALSISKAALSGISGRGSAEVQYNLQIQEIEIQKDIIRGELNLAQALFLNTQAIEKSNNTSELKRLSDLLNSGNLSKKEVSETSDKINKLTNSISNSEQITTIIKAIGNNFGKLSQATKVASPEVGVALQGYQAPLLGGQSKLIGLDAQATIAKNKEIIDQLKEQSTYKIDQNNLTIKDIDQQSKALEIQKQTNLISEDEYITRGTALSISKQEVDNQNEKLKLQGELSVLTKQLEQGGAKNSAASQAVADKKVELVKAEARGVETINQLLDAGTNKLIEQRDLRSDTLKKTTTDFEVVKGNISPEKGQEDISAVERLALVRKNASEEEIAAFDIKQKSIEYTAEYTVATRELGFEIDKTNKLQSKTISLADQLAKSFGRVGAAVGLVAKATTQSATDRLKVEQKLFDDKEKLSKRYDKTEAQKTTEGVQLEKEAATEKAGINLNMYADIAGAAANSFDQQSGAAKAFHTIEKVFHLAKLAMDIEAMVSSVAVAGLEATLAASVATAWIPAVWARAFGEGGPYLGWALGAAAVAMIGLSASSGGGGPTGPSSADLEKAQGTGQKYDSNGKLVDTGFGVLGDSSAKSESISKSLDLVAKYTFEELEYSNRMLSALKDIANSLQGVSKSLVLTSGLTTGTAFGTNVGQDNHFGGSIFGGNTSTDITGSGIQLSGTVAQLANKSAMAQQYETGTVTSKGGWFSSDSTDAFKKVTELSDSVKTSLSLTFDNIRKGLIAAGTSIGIGAEDLTNKINSIPVDVSIELRGLKGKELEDAVSSVLSATLDEITEKALDVVKPFQKMGEGLAETAFRVANDSRVIDLQLQSVGKVFGSMGLDSLKAREALIDLSGGIEQFTSDSNYFKDNFLTSAQKLIPVQKAVSDELARLGLSSIDSRAKFADLVTSIDLSTASGQDLYTSLMKLEKGFAAVYDATEEISLSAKDLATAKLGQLGKIMDLLGDKVGSTNLSRKIELQGMDSRLKANQLWIYAMEDEASARDALKTAYDSEVSARQSTIDSLTTSRNTLLDFSKTLALGATSPLTPGQKYAQAKADLSGITSVINDSLATKEDKATAINKLPGAISTFLETSKIFNASSAAFQQDYAYSQKLLDINTDKLSDQISIEQKQLDYMKDQVRGLGLIDTGISTVNSSINDIQKLIAKSLDVQSAAQAANPGQDYGSGAFIKSIFANTPGLSAGSAPIIGHFADLISSGKDTKDKFIQEIPNIVKLTSWYAKVLHRDPDPGGLQFWLNAFNDGVLSETQIKTSFAFAAARDNGLAQIPSIDAFAKGGLASGMSLVGEQGPELVDFTNPGRVYSNSNSSDMFSNFGSNIAEELKELRKEVAQLRLEANRNSIQEIQANYDANMQNADILSNNISDTASRSNFDLTKNTPKLL